MPKLRYASAQRVRGRVMHNSPTGKMLCLEMAIEMSMEGSTAASVITKAKAFEDYLHHDDEAISLKMEELASNFKNAHAYAWEVGHRGELRDIFHELSEDNPFINDNWADNLIRAMPPTDDQF